jgi:OmcA/MtrC family decaheme c-type cytochrome
METILRGLLLMATAGALVFPSAPPPAANATVSSRGRSVTAPTAPKAAAQFKADQLEAYLNDDGIAYIRPGVKIKINSITNVVAGQKPVIEFSLTDQFDQPLDRNGKVTPGPIAPSFIMGKWDPTTRYYKNLTLRTSNGVTNPSTDRNGTFQDLEVGHYKYTFATAMSADVTPSTTLTLGAYAKRTLKDIIGKDYFADNVLTDFRPDGATPDKTWGAMAVANTCNNCHDPLALHGSNRRDVELCMMCHNNQINPDPTTGQPFNGKAFYHRIHMGESLPSVLAGGTNYAGGDWSTIALPQDIRNCTICHDPKAAEADIWYTRPNRTACGSCHDDINWTTGANHPAGPMADDTACAKCHVPASGQEFDASIQGAHTNPLKSKQLKGLSFQIVSVTNAAAGKKPTAVYAIKNGDGTAVDGTKLATFAPMLAGPTTSYSKYYRENGVAGSTNTNPGVFDATAGTTTYTFTNAIPADAKGTWSVTADIYRNVTLKKADGTSLPAQREAAFNNIKYVGITDATPVARRTSVVLSQCNTCHDQLALHGGQRMNTQECVICHNPTEGDQARRPATAGAKESISFSRLIHRIHTGEELTQDFTVYGFGGSVNNFNEVRFPGDRRNCAKCHTATGYTLPLQPGIQTVTTLRDYFSPQGPATASCLGCHDNVDAAAHAYLNTTNFGGTATAEACATCHGTGKDWDVAKVHAR